MLFFSLNKTKQNNHNKHHPKSCPLLFLSKHFRQGHKCTGSIDFWLQTTFQAAFKSQFLA